MRNGKVNQPQKPRRRQVHLFTDIEQSFVELFVNTPENVEVKNEEAANAGVFIPLVDF